MSDTPNQETNMTFSKEEKFTVKTGDSVSSGNSKKPLITVTTETEILKKIEAHCETWNRISIAYNVCIIIFGLSAVSTSVLVSIYTGEKVIGVNTIKILACISTISLSVLTAFNLVSNASNARTAWRSLNAAMMMYKAGSISIQELIEQYQKGENQMGNLTFNYGTNSDKPATYSHDIKGKEDSTDQNGNEVNEQIQGNLEGKGNDEEMTVQNSENENKINKALIDLGKTDEIAKHVKDENEKEE